MPGTMLVGRNATCSVSAKKLSTLRLSVILPIDPDRHVLLRDQLGRVEHVIGLRVGERLVEHLDAELPFREVAACRSPRTGRGGGSRCRPPASFSASSQIGRLEPELRLPVELDEARLALGVDQPEGVDAEPLHHPRSERGSVRSDIAHISMCVVSGISDAKSQKVSCALPACG